jgi:hypothetical protein
MIGIDRQMSTVLDLVIHSFAMDLGFGTIQVDHS